MQFTFFFFFKKCANQNYITMFLNGTLCLTWIQFEDKVGNSAAWGEIMTRPQVHYPPTDSQECQLAAVLTLMSIVT